MYRYRSVFFGIIFGLFLINGVFAVEQGAYTEYIINDILIYPTSSVDVSRDTSTRVSQGLYLFKRASENISDAQIVGEAFEFWKDLYETKGNEDNFILLAYMGTLEAMYGGVTRGLIKKTRLAKAGLDKLSSAAEISLKRGTNLEKFYTYFLLSQTLVNLPTFFREFKKDAKPSLKRTSRYFNKMLTEEYKEERLNILKSNLFLAYGLYYHKVNQDYKARTYYDWVLSLEGDIYEGVKNQALKDQKALRG